MKRILFISLTAALILSAGCGASPLQRSFDMAGGGPAVAGNDVRNADGSPGSLLMDFASNAAGGGGFEPAPWNGSSSRTPT
jgi:hypothetical protein